MDRKSPGPRLFAVKRALWKGLIMDHVMETQIGRQFPSIWDVVLSHGQDADG